MIEKRIQIVSYYLEMWDNDNDDNEGKEEDDNDDNDNDDEGNMCLYLCPYLNWTWIYESEYKLLVIT